MNPSITFFPLGNADTALITLSNNRLVLIDYASMKDENDENDKRCNLESEIKKILCQTGNKDFSVVCFTHLDADHVKGMSDFFELDSNKSTQNEGRPKINELWVPAAAILEKGSEDDAFSLRKEARYRLKNKSGIKVFSRPEALKDWLAENELTIDEVKHCIIDAGKIVSTFNINDDGVEFFVHCPFAWKLDQRGATDRNQDSIVFQAEFKVEGNSVKAFFGSDIDSETIDNIVELSKKHHNEDKLGWDILKIFHHCSYKALNKDEKGKDCTTPIKNVEFLLKECSCDNCFLVSSSKPIPRKNTKEDEDDQPPHRQAASYYNKIARLKKGELRVTMEYPDEHNPKPFMIEITKCGARFKRLFSSTLISIASREMRAGLCMNGSKISN